MLETKGPVLPQAWIAGDDAMGRPYWLRRRLAALGTRDMLAVPSNTLSRELETALPAHHGRGRRPQRPWQGVDTWAPRLTMTPGGRSTSAMVPKDPWESTASNDAWCRARTGVSKATRRWWS